MAKKLKKSRNNESNLPGKTAATDRTRNSPPLHSKDPGATSSVSAPSSPLPTAWLASKLASPASPVTAASLPKPEVVNLSVTGEVEVPAYAVSIEDGTSSHGVGTLGSDTDSVMVNNSGVGTMGRSPSLIALSMSTSPGGGGGGFGVGRRSSLAETGSASPLLEGHHHSSQPIHETPNSHERIASVTSYVTSSSPQTPFLSSSASSIHSTSNTVNTANGGGSSALSLLRDKLNNDRIEREKLEAIAVAKEAAAATAGAPQKLKKKQRPSDVQGNAVPGRTRGNDGDDDDEEVDMEGEEATIRQDSLLEEDPLPEGVAALVEGDLLQQPVTTTTSSSSSGRFGLSGIVSRPFQVAESAASFGIQTTKSIVVDLPLGIARKVPVFGKFFKPREKENTRGANDHTPVEVNKNPKHPTITSSISATDLKSASSIERENHLEEEEDEEGEGELSVDKHGLLWDAVETGLGLGVAGVLVASVSASLLWEKARGTSKKAEQNL